MTNLEQLECYDIPGLLYLIQVNLSKHRDCYNLCIMDGLLDDGSADRCVRYNANCDRCIACYLEEHSKEG